MNKALLDTDSFSEIGRGVNPAVIRNASAYRVVFGRYTSFDLVGAELAGRIEGDLDRVGQPIGQADPMIAATALHSGLELVTGNTAHYARIQNLGYPLILVDWRA